MEPSIHSPASGFVALYGRFAVRLRAMVIDLMIVVGVLVIGIVIVDVIGSYMPSGVLMAGLMAAVVLYDPILVSRFGGTIGHRTANLRVVDAESGRRIGFVRALVRFMLKAVLGIASFVIMVLTRRHQALHAEDVFFNVVGVVLIVGIAGIVVVGWRGRLYGARGSRSIGNSTDS